VKPCLTDGNQLLSLSVT